MTSPAQEREEFWQRVTIPEDRTRCWVWNRAVNRKGFGRVQWDNRPWTAHRLAWHLFKGPIPEGAWVLHLKGCSNACVNLDHLYLGDAQEAARKRGLKDRCINGHRYTPENTYTRSNRPSSRECKICQRNNYKSWVDRQALLAMGIQPLDGV